MERDSEDSCSKTIKYLKDNGISLGAVHDIIRPLTGKNYMFFSIRKL